MHPSQNVRLDPDGFFDFGSRVGRIHNSYQAGKQWERDLFIESSSFVASAITATAFVKTGLSLINGVRP